MCTGPEDRDLRRGEGGLREPGVEAVHGRGGGRGYRVSEGVDRRAVAGGAGGMRLETTRAQHWSFFGVALPGERCALASWPGYRPKPRSTAAHGLEAHATIHLRILIVYVSGSADWESASVAVSPESL